MSVEGEALLGRTFPKARLAAPSIIFFDEADAIAPKRQLMLHFCMRPGRFDLVLHVPPPDEDKRVCLEILWIHTRNMKLEQDRC